jgi:hypothetical protein
MNRIYAQAVWLAAVWPVFGRRLGGRLGLYLKVHVHAPVIAIWLQDPTS